MEISFKSRRLEKTFTRRGGLRKAYGDRMERVIRNRVNLLLGASNLSEVAAGPPVRRHQLTGTRKGQFAIDLVHPYRLILKPNHEPVPRKDDGGIDLYQVTAIKIIGVVDYH